MYLNSRIPVVLNTYALSHLPDKICPKSIFADTVGNLFMQRQTSIFHKVIYITRHTKQIIQK